MKCVIFGINGQDGYYLRKIFEQNRVKVIGVSRSLGDWLQGNVADFNFVDNFIQTQKPDYIVHIAANSNTRHDVLFENHETIATGSLNILEAVKRHQPNCRVFITGSGVQFVNNGRPIKETDDFEANSPYSVARIQSAYAARYYRGLGIKAYVGYLFHHESSLRKESHVGKMVVEAVKRIAKGSEEKIRIGDISVQKEWGFAGDIAEGIYTLIKQDNIFELTIGTGKAYSIKDWIRNCFAQIDMPWEKYVDISESNFRSEYKLLVSNPSSILSLGWRPKVDIKTLAKLMIEGAL